MALVALSVIEQRYRAVMAVRDGVAVTELAADGAVPAGPPPLPPAENGSVIEVDRAVNNSGLAGLAGLPVLAAEILGGRPVIVRIEPQTPMFLDPDKRELLRTRPNPLTHAGAAPARRAARRPATAPAGRAGHRSAPGQPSGVITVCWHHVSLGRIHAGRIVRAGETGSIFKRT